MGMVKEEMDLSEWTKPEDVEQDGLPPGWYQAMVMDVSIDEKSKGAVVLKFEVTAGPLKGRAITEKLWNPKHANTSEAAEMSKRRRALFVKRLGLVAESDFGKPGVSVEWDNAIGKTFAIEVKERKYTDKDGNSKVSRNIDFAGVYPLEHEKVPEHLRHGVDSNPAAAVATEDARKTSAATGGGRVDENAFDGM